MKIVYFPLTIVKHIGRWSSLGSSSQFFRPLSFPLAASSTRKAFSTGETDFVGYFLVKSENRISSAATCIPEKMRETYLYLGDQVRRGRRRSLEMKETPFQATDTKGRECLKWRDVYARFEKLRKDNGAKSEP